MDKKWRVVQVSPVFDVSVGVPSVEVKWHRGWSFCSEDQIIDLRYNHIFWFSWYEFMIYEFFMNYSYPYKFMDINLISQKHNKLTDELFSVN